MTENDVALRVGRLMCDLAECIQELNHARSEAHDLVSNLRILADCFDRDIQAVSIRELHGDTRFTVRDKRQPEHGTRRAVRFIPSGNRLMEIALRIQRAKDQAEDLLNQLRNENIDVRGICKALAIE